MFKAKNGQGFEAASATSIILAQRCKGLKKTSADFHTVFTEKPTPFNKKRPFSALPFFFDAYAGLVG
ncbi:hypothetical protein FFV09_14405 [Saccharibacillus brassicae]|uniref:Uncharacterized protein n=2 Tax=Saccharibacillus brassicae TaxID=2583377 RepID=A0A4Y6UZA2_SACBS|nr:hypothetical protein FFV09_14405 [Saccharibacillus brassicae]